jgi:predicted ATPase/DNA-binding CsgD family transcriptional regulator
MARWLDGGMGANVQIVGEVLAGPVPAERTHNLPAGLTSFLGRASESARLEAMLARHRLVTVTGAGGSGKTRMAIEVARALVPRFGDGVWLVELAQVDDPGLVPTAVAVVLGVREHPGLSLADSLAVVMGGRHLLLVLDNCEHVIDAVAGLCDKLLRAGDDLRVLATSREALEVAGEARFPLPPLPVPASETAAGFAGYESVALFVERAAQADPDFTLTPASAPIVATIVRRLDGMPLAIELAAAQADTLGLDELVAGLDDRFRVLVSGTRGVAGRQASLAAAVEWSYRLLGEPERRALRRLSVFPAPFTLSAARAAVGPDAAMLVPRLVRRSLLVAPRAGPDGRSRYRLLETLRAYGLARLEECGERDETAAAVATWTLSEAGRAAATFETPDDQFAGQWGDAERDNLREVLGWLLEHDPERAVRLAVAMSPWWFLRGHYREGGSFLERGLLAAPGLTDELVGSAERWLGVMAQYRSDFDGALAHYGRAEEVLTGRGPSRVLADCLNGQTVALLNTDRPGEASVTAVRALEMARAAGYESGESYACATISMAASYAGDTRSALAWAHTSQQVDQRGVSGHNARWAATALASALADDGDVAGAEVVLNEILDRCRKAGDRSWEAMQLESLARIALKTGRREEAGPQIREAIRIASEVGNRLRLTDCLGTAAVWAGPGDPETAAVFWGASRALGEQIGTVRLAITDIIDVSDTVSAADSEFLTGPMLAVRAKLGPARARMADQRGASMPFDAIVKFALTVLPDSPPAAAGGVLPATAGLTPRERELVALVAEGLTDSQIASALFISIRTVRSHLDRIRDKTGARRRADLTRLALGDRPR